MALYYWQIFAAAATVSVVIISLVLPLILSEIFPWRNLHRRKNAKLANPSKSFKGKTVLITGANGAFGSRVAKMIADLDVETLILADVKDCAAIKQRIEVETKATRKPDIQVWQVDMMSYQSCWAFAKKAQELKSLDAVLLAAGILSFNRQESPEGWETCQYKYQITFVPLDEILTQVLAIQVNYLSTALIALLLLPALKPSPSNPEAPVITFVTSFGVYPASPFMAPPKSGSYLKYLNNNKDGMMQANQYGRSKGLLLYFARELASRVSGAQGPQVTVNSTDPGSAWTPLTRPNEGMLIPRLIMNMSARDPETCAKVLVNGVCATEQTHGGILVDYDLSP